MTINYQKQNQTILQRFKKDGRTHMDILHPEANLLVKGEEIKHPQYSFITVDEVIETRPAKKAEQFEGLPPAWARIIVTAMDKPLETFGYSKPENPPK
jgi:hypothetical protein